MKNQFSPILMCRPSFYEVGYVINPWMSGNVNRSSRTIAQQQWQGLHEVLSGLTTVLELEPQPGCPDLVFTANAGLVIGNIAVPSRFLHPERQVEEPHFTQWFEQSGFDVHQLPADLPFEGAGDALIDRELPLLWAAYGFRTELQSHAHLTHIFDMEVVSLRLVDPRFYHLDTCFCPLENGFLLYYPPAFDTQSKATIESRVPAEKRLPIGEVDALNFACNAVNLGSHIVVNRATDALKATLNRAGFEIIETPLDEFLKAGGAAKCLTLRTQETIASRTIGEETEKATLPHRILLFKGHLLDSGTMSRILDAVIEGGGSFKILEFTLGEQRHSPSEARIQITAPSLTTLDTISAHLIDLGGIPESVAEAIPVARLETVIQDGVAPDDFYVTTIYPTEIRWNNGWLRVQKQRMDAVIALSSDETQATCKLIRELVKNERIVIGVDGIRTQRNTTSGQNSEKKMASEEFHFMGAGISSERRVELAVENIAWELQRLRAQNRKVAVVAGPVVIHTGGAAHLARLIREGYVGALLAGNALAVHDIEQSMFGTSLGVDVGRGTAVHGGHRHHLRVINTVRRYGGIRQAVEAGAITSGIFYECIKHDVPFSLAGSIRDDGPLPDTQMDLIQAQNDYARLLEDSQMTLLLSTMLHSIGAGNMTPAGVRLVCVDINPAVVTKLSDRGSLESVGIVTDVGLFLSLLVQKLEKS